MTVARIAVTVTGRGPWQASFADGDGAIASCEVAAVVDGERRYPARGAAPAGGDVVDVGATVASLSRGEATPTEAAALGRHLFAALCRPVWREVEARLSAAPPELIELALDLDDAPELRGLPWELMADDTGWLARGVKLGARLIDVAITRRTVRGAATSPALAQPLRYLFAIGTGIDDPVRAGAECIGLLRQIGPAVHERVVQRQSLAELTRVVAEHDPHVVHLICHGRESEAHGVELELWDADRNDRTLVPGAALAEALVRTGSDGVRRAPAVVVLAACSSSDRMLAPGDAGLARELVAAGVPVVIGMGAAIHDQPVRLFTRGFGQALVDRTPILAAACRSRRAALRGTDTADAACDWGLVQVVLGHDVDVELAVAPAGHDSDEARVMDWLAGAALPIDLAADTRVNPPLCADAEALEALHRLLVARPGAPAGLILAARPPREGVRVGKRRMLAELAATAIRAGHVPVVLLPNARTGWPRSEAQVVERLADAFEAAWQRHGLGTPPPLRLRDLTGPSVRDRDLATALEVDCRALRERARHYPFIARAGGQVVLMLHDAHRYGDGARLVLDLLLVRGAALRKIAPVVVSWRWTPDQARDNSTRVHDDELRSTLATGRAWLRTVEIGPLAPVDFERDDLGLSTIPLAARLALQRVLLHPYRARPDYAARRWFLDLRRDRPEDHRALIPLVLSTDGCCPGQFADRSFLGGLFQVKDELTAADDDDVLEAGGGSP